jgi:hypothetical protein
MKCEAKVLGSLPKGRLQDAGQSRPPLLPAPPGSNYRKFEVAVEPIFNIRKIFYGKRDADTFTLLFKPLLTTIQIHAKP